MLVSQVIEKIEAFAPVRLAGEWDNVGLMVGDRSGVVKKILLTLDVDLEVAREAAREGANLIVSHHPMIFEPLKKINADTRQGECILFLARNGISFYAAHTNLDAAEGGLNDYLAGLYGLKEIKPTDIIYTDEQGKKYGLGRLGILPEPMTLQALAERVAERLGLPAISYVGNPGTEVRKVAVCSGGGGNRVSSALAEIADVYITGDVKYSNARDAQDFGLPLIIAGHYDTEIFCMDIFEKLLSPLGIPLLRSGANTNVVQTISLKE